jgi:glycosyltransferase involved in cell wall biosynthesis
VAQRAGALGRGMERAPAPPADMTTPLISVILPTRNRAALLPRSIESVLTQDYANLELIVVDDASTDATPGILAAIGDPRVRVLRNAQAGGAAAARNTALRAARGELLAFNDDDDLWLPGKLTRQVAALAADDAQWCLSGFYRDSIHGRSYVGGESMWRQLSFDGGIGSVRDEGGPDWSLIATPGWLVKRDVLDRVGGFDERMRSFDDWELGLRLDAVCRRVFVDAPLFVQDTHLGGGMTRDEKARLRDLRIIMEKHPQRWAQHPATQARHEYLLRVLAETHEPLVSVVLQACNRAFTLATAARSVLDQTYPNLELLVVDNGSTDATEGIVRDLDDPRVRYLRLPHGRPATALNAGVDAARGDWIAFQDSEAHWLPHKLARQVALLPVAADVGVIVCGHRELRPEQDGGIDGDDPMARGDPRGSLLAGLRYSAPTWLVRKAALRRAGGFDQSLPSCEDHDLAFRLNDTCRFLHVPEVLVVSHDRSDSVFNRPAARTEGFRRVLERHRRRWRGSRLQLARHEFTLACWLLHGYPRRLRAYWYFWRAARHEPARRAAARQLVLEDLRRRLPAWLQPSRDAAPAIAPSVALRASGVSARDLPQGYDPRVEVPAGSVDRLRRDHPRLRELQQRYRDPRFAEPGPAGRWAPAAVGAELALPWFRGERGYLPQYRLLGPDAHRQMLAFADHVASRDGLGLLRRLGEDGQFGCCTFVHPRWGRVSRDLLESVSEISFLERHLALSGRRNLRIADIGAGYGRLAHRLCAALDSVARHDCFDAVPESTFLADYYLGFRQVTRARSVPLFEAEQALRGGHDLAVSAHTFDECTPAAIRWWLERLAAAAIPWLLIVSNEGDELQCQAPSGSRDFTPLLAAAGYRLERREPAIDDAALRDVVGLRHGFHLYRFAP